MFYLLIFLIIDYFVVHTLTQYVEATELANTIADPENVLGDDNSEDGLDNIIFEDDIRATEILAYTSATVCITVIVIHTFGMPSVGFISSLSSIW